MHDCWGHHGRLPVRPLHTTIANLGNVNVRLPKFQKLDEAADAPVKILHIKNKRFLYRSSTHASNNDSSVNAVRYKPDRDHLEQTAKNKAVKGNKEEKLERDRREDVQLRAKFRTH